MRVTFLLALLALACHSAPPRPSAPPTGRFIVHYGPATPEFEDFRAGLIANRFLDTIAARLNDSLSIPKDVTLATTGPTAIRYGVQYYATGVATAGNVRSDVIYEASYD